MDSALHAADFVGDFSTSLKSREDEIIATFHNGKN
jgi:hypothetical protein